MCIRIPSYVGLLYCVVVIYFDVSKELTVSICRVTKLVCVDVEMIRRVKIVWHVGRFQVIWPNCATLVGRKRIGFCLCQAHNDSKVLLKCKQ